MYKTAEEFVQAAIDKAMNKHAENYENKECVNELCDDNPMPMKNAENDRTSLVATQWSSMDGKIIPVSNTFKTLEAGYYSIGYSNNIGLYFQKENISLNKLYRLPNDATDIVLDDINRFWTLEPIYKKYNRVFRRNYLLYSAPGTGKTSLINLMCQDLIEKYNGIVFQLQCGADIENFPEVVRRIRKIEPDRKIITIIEDIDAFADNNRDSSLNSLILNFLDGNGKMGGMVTIATTNHIESLESRYKNRPSRFARVIEFPLPNEESRRVFIEKSVMPEDLKKIDIDKWVEKTKGMTIDFIEQLITLFFIHGYPEDECFNTILQMHKNNNKLKNETSVNKKNTIGFVGNYSEKAIGN